MSATDLRPRLVKKPAALPRRARRGRHPTYDEHRRHHVRKFQEKLRRLEDADPALIERHQQVFAFFAARLGSPPIASVPISARHRQWILDHRDDGVGVWEFVRLAYYQHCVAVAWPL